MRFDLFAVFALIGLTVASNEGFEVKIKRQRPPVGQPAMAGPDGVVRVYDASQVVKSEKK